ncbi:MAG: ATP-binding cassette domain-containing protein [Spirochaetales bacterium]
MPERPLSLKAVHLHTGYEKANVLPAVDFELEPGQSLALVGGNGSGKTTLLRTIAGLLPAISGRLVVLGTTPTKAVRRLAWLGQFQTTNPLLPLRGRDVVRMAFYGERGLWRRITAADEKVVDEALETFGATEFAQQPVSDLSGGQRQRIYLSYVLARRAELVLLDEPLSNLDAGGMEVFYRAVKALAERGASVITATHNLEDAADCDFALVLGAEEARFGPGRELLATLGHSH